MTDAEIMNLARQAAAETYLAPGIRGEYLSGRYDQSSIVQAAARALTNLRKRKAA